MRSDQRQFFIFDLEIDVRKGGGIPPSMNVAVNVWQKMKIRKERYEINNASAAMIIGDIEHAADYVVMLVRLSDTKAPNSVYSDLTNDEFTEHEKAETTGSDVGCHVIISKIQERNQPNVYTCAIERIPGLPSALVKRLLSKFLHTEFTENAESFSYPSPAGGFDREGNPRIERCCPHIEIRGRPSDQFIRDLDEGILTGVKLIRAEAVTPMTGAGYLVKEASELRLQVVRNNVPAKVWNSLRGMLNNYARDYGRSEISYKLPNSRRVVTVEIDNANGNPINELYIKLFEVMNIFPPLAQSAQGIVPRLRDAAVPQFLANRTI